ncbi:tetratricopeptide repeat protein [Bacteroidota bacterium]
MQKRNLRLTSPPQKKKKLNAAFLPDQIAWKEFFKSKLFISLIFLTILIILFSFRTIYNYDLGFHLRGGQWITENLTVPDNDVYTYTVNHNKYVDMHWLYQVIVYGIYSLFSYVGIILMNSIFILVVFYLLLKRMMFYGIPIWLSVLALLLTLITIQNRFYFRPEILTWIGILIVLLLMDQYFYFKKRLLFLLPIVMVIWVNVQGLFVLGLFIIVVYFFSIWVHEKKFDSYVFKWSVVIFLVTFINPYFEKIVFQPFVLLKSASIFSTTISELNSPFNYTGNIGNFYIEIYLYYVICVLSFALFFITIKKRKLHEFLILAVFFYISYLQFRSIPIFVIYAINIIAITLSEVLKDNRKVKVLFDKYGKFSKLVPYSITVIIILISLRVYNNAYFASYNMGIDFGVGLNENILPINSSEFLVENKLDGRLINELGFGGWFVWKLPQPVFIDGRLEVMKEEFYTEYQNSFYEGGLKILIDKYKPQLIVYNHAFANNWSALLRTLPDWRIIYLDKNSIIYARRDYAENIPKMSLEDVLVSNEFDTNITEQKVSEIFKIKPKSQFSNWLSGFYEKEINYTGLSNLALYAIECEDYRAAEIIYLNIIKSTDGRLDKFHMNLYNNLGNIYFIRNDLNKALYCYHIYLMNNPDDEQLKEKVKYLESKTGISY